MLCYYTHGEVRIRPTVVYVHGSMHPESISIIVQQDATLYSFYSLQTSLYVSGDTFTHRQEHEQWCTQEFCWGGGQQLQLRTEDRENGDMRAVAP
jgi:hypothetical protein